MAPDESALGEEFPSLAGIVAPLWEESYIEAQAVNDMAVLQTDLTFFDQGSIMSLGNDTLHRQMLFGESILPDGGLDSLEPTPWWEDGGNSPLITPHFLASPSLAMLDTTPADLQSGYTPVPLACLELYPSSTSHFPVDNSQAGENDVVVGSGQDNRLRSGKKKKHAAKPRGKRDKPGGSKKPTPSRSAPATLVLAVAAPLQRSRRARGRQEKGEKEDELQPRGTDPSALGFKPHRDLAQHAARHLHAPGHGLEDIVDIDGGEDDEDDEDDEGAALASAAVDTFGYRARLPGKRGYIEAPKGRAMSKAAIAQLKADSQGAEEQYDSLLAEATSLWDEVLDLRMEILRHHDCDCELIQTYVQNAARAISASGGRPVVWGTGSAEAGSCC